MLYNENRSGSDKNTGEKDDKNGYQEWTGNIGTPEESNEIQTDDWHRHDEEDEYENKRYRHGSYNDDSLDNSEYNEEGSVEQFGGRRGINTGSSAGGYVAPGRDSLRQGTPGIQGFNSPGISSEEQEAGDKESADVTARPASEEPEHQFNVTPEGNGFTLKEESSSSSKADGNTLDLEDSAIAGNNAKNP